MALAVFQVGHHGKISSISTCAISAILEIVFVFLWHSFDSVQSRPKIPRFKSRAVVNLALNYQSDGVGQTLVSPQLLWIRPESIFTNLLRFHESREINRGKPSIRNGIDSADDFDTVRI